MRNKVFKIFVGCIVSGCYFLVVGSSNGRATAENEGNTGAPGDASNTCINCHNGGPIQVEIDLKMLNAANEEVVKYIPEEEYTLRVEISGTSGSISGYGFQLVCLSDIDNSGVVGWNNPGSNVKLAAAKGRNYAEHNGISNTNVFEVGWKAPAVGKGDLTFYTCGNGVNKNGKTSGDGAAKTTLKVTEGDLSGLSDYYNHAFKVYPNPFNDQIIIEGQPESIKIVNQQGQMVDVNYNRGTSIVNTQKFKPGLYFLILKMENQTKILKLVKF